MLTTPYLALDMDILGGNIRCKAAQLREHGIAHRPHIKTHKSIEIARMQLEAGAAGITASKLGEARVFFDAGFDNILVAYNIVGRDKLERFAAMHRQRTMLTTADSLFVARGLDDVGRATGKKVNLLVELNLGENRCGVKPGDLRRFASELKDLGGIGVSGVMSYRGSIYGCADEAARIRVIEEERDALLEAQRVLRSFGFPADITSTGSTVASSYPHLLGGVSEIRCGNYVFNDVNNLVSGAADLSDCALRAVATVISLPAPGRATLDLGTKVLSGDRSKREGFGLIAGKPKAVIEAMNEEHAMVCANGESFALGERVEIIPNHSCVAVNLADTVYGVSGGILIKEFSVDARGKYN